MSDSTERLLSMMETMMISVDKSINGLEQRLTTRIDGLDARMAGLEVRMAGLDARMAGLEVRFEEQARDIKGIADGVSFLMERRGEDELWKTEISACVLKLEVDVHELKKRTSPPLASSTR